MKAIVLFGAVLALLGLIAFAMPSFNTEETKDVVKLGDLKVQAKTEEPHFIPPIRKWRSDGAWYSADRRGNGDEPSVGDSTDGPSQGLK
jgi:hypothetical protein